MNTVVQKSKENAPSASKTFLGGTKSLQCNNIIQSSPGVKRVRETDSFDQSEDHTPKKQLSWHMKDVFDVQVPEFPQTPSHNATYDSNIIDLISNGHHDVNNSVVYTQRKNVIKQFDLLNTSTSSIEQPCA